MRAFIKPITFALFVFAITLCGFCQDATKDAPPAETKQAHGELALQVQGIAELTALGRPLSKFLPESVANAMKLRDLFLADEGKGIETRATAIQNLSHVFAAQYSERLKEDFQAPAIFDFSNIEFESAIRGTETCPTATQTFGPFTGKWYGRWAEFDVDHHWSRVVKQSEHSFAADFPEFQIGWQYAWIGDGYGINHCVSFEEQGRTKRFILGYTEHLQGGDFTKITARRPHLGISAGSGKLIWITAREVFFEETHPDKEGKLDSYSIIGFRYDEKTVDAKTQFAFGEGFVAEYSRDSNRRVPFRTFNLSELATTQGAAQESE